MDSITHQPQPQQVSALSSVIRDANACIERLLSLLDIEREALTLGDLDKISNSVNLKVECVAQIEQLDNKRVELCRLLSITNEDIDEFLAKHDSGYSQGEWQTLLVNLQQCRDANTVNGSVTRIRRGHIEKALQVLRGGTTETPALYGPDGLEHVKDVTTLGQA